MATVFTSRVLVFLGWFTIIVGGAITGGGAVSALVILGTSWYVWVAVAMWVVFWAYLTALVWCLVVALWSVLNRVEIRDEARIPV